MTQALPIPRRAPRWLRLAFGVPVLTVMGSVMTGLVWAIVSALHRSMTSEGASVVEVLGRELGLFLLAGGFFGVIVGLPVVGFVWLAGHFLTPRRPRDGMLLGALAGSFAAGLFAMVFEFELLLYSFATVPIGAVLGLVICRYGYRDPQPV